MVALCSSTLRSQSPGRKNDQVFSVYTLTHLLCAGVYIAVVASNSLQNYFTISPQLLTVISSLVSFSIHVLFFPLLNPCLIIPNSSLFITNEEKHYLIFSFSGIVPLPCCKLFFSSCLSFLALYCLVAPVSFQGLSNYDWYTYKDRMIPDHYSILYCS